MNSNTIEPEKIPLANVKRVMKEDPEVVAVSNTAVEYMASSVQLFIHHFTEQALLAARAEGRERIGYADFAKVAQENREMQFVGRIIPKQQPFKDIFAQRVAADFHDDGPSIPFPRKEEEIEADEEDLSD
ncbi:hypothetical protein DASB73_032430 [Starmerella bacillaris]|uniref:Transcription factor CBF/NF-Y/archaeal histone domain-containing protein n=1 Tax=Starmerella bacillaris TaxID=1247836 RepID=A0AAV5RLI9_STABA|nr:hypothetical protein DASB73_032430 [Starmerella bacillaris]